MKDRHEKEVRQIIKVSTKRIIGRTKAKELNERAFLRAFFNNFDVDCKSDPDLSVLRKRMKVQEILGNHLVDPIGMHHEKEFDEEGFIVGLYKEFELKLK